MSLESGRSARWGRAQRTPAASRGGGDRRVRDGPDL